MNLSHITDRLWLGSSPETPADIQTLLDGGVTHLLDVRLEFDDSSLFPPGTLHPFKGYCWNPIKDDPWPTWTPKPVGWYERSLDFAMPLWQQRGHRLYVHCKLGINRSVATVAAILRALGFDQPETAMIIVMRRPPGLVSAAIWQAGDMEAALKTLGWT